MIPFKFLAASFAIATALCPSSSFARDEVAWTGPGYYLVFWSDDFTEFDLIKGPYPSHDDCTAALDEVQRKEGVLATVKLDCYQIDTKN